ncbi:hypothetical protein ABBQ32_004815 [Trebouxia sp. C0010 RCD-2024]
MSVTGILGPCSDLHRKPYPRDKGAQKQRHRQMLQGQHVSSGSAQPDEPTWQQPAQKQPTEQAPPQEQAPPPQDSSPALSRRSSQALRGMMLTQIVRWRAAAFASGQP